MRLAASLRLLLTAAILACLSACSTLQDAGEASQQSSASNPPHSAQPAASTATGGPQPAASSNSTSPSPAPFQQVIKGAQRQDGLLPIWRRQDNGRMWIELSPQAFGKPLFLSPKLATGIGEAGVFGGLMQSRWAQVGRPQWVEFRKVNQQVQLVAINATYIAQHGTPQARAVASAFSPSLVASVPVASMPQASSGAVLIDANALMLTDMLGMAQHLQRTYRQSYALDTRNSALRQVVTQDKALVIEVSQHFATAGISSSTGAPGTAGTLAAPPSSVPQSVPDPRSLFVTVHYTLTPLPELPMATRPADARVGYFATTVADFTNDLARTPRVRHINRWRLEKKDPAATLSEPVRPLVYWLDPSIPEDYRATIREGVLEWNKAFEAIGFRNAIEVRESPADQALDTLQTGNASIRWMTNSQPGFGAIGPTHVDPRTGEILHAVIGLESLSSRAIRATRSQILQDDDVSARQSTHTHDAACQHGTLAAEQLNWALDVLEARGMLDPDGPEVRAFVLAYLKDTTMHEVGHTLGLRHNFKASRWRTAEELSDPELGKAHGNSASVMDYTPINLPMPGQRAGVPFQTTLGPYDYWAIEYGYKPLPADKDQAAATLRTIAQRSTAPTWAEALAYGTDEDNAEALDPQSQAFDLGRDPLVFARTRLAIVRELFLRQASRVMTPEDDPALLRRSVSFGLREMARTGQILLRQVGGIVTRRDGAGSGRDLLAPVPATQQRAALQLLVKDFLSPDAVKLPPALLRRLAPDYLDRQGADGHGLSAASTDFSWAMQQLTLQRLVLSVLMNESLAERLIDNIDKTRDTEKRPLTPQELHRTLRQAIWRDAAWTPTQDSALRNLQREHVNRLASAIVRNASSRADVRALLRDEARQLLQQLRVHPQQRGAGIDAAHRRDCIDTLAAALAANVVRAAP